MVTVLHLVHSRRAGKTAARKVCAYSDLLARRAALIDAWTAWLATSPSAEDVEQEIDGTSGAMRGLAKLLTVPPGANILP